jgi:thiol-disulfide isomerase/thioredoxin
VTEPAPAPDALLRGLRPIPTYRDHPAPVGRDVEGVDPSGEQVRVPIVGSDRPVLLLFLSSGCLGCRDLWEGAVELAGMLPGQVRVVVVTRGPGEEDPAAIAGWAAALAEHGGIDVVMSSQAYRDYAVQGPPFYSLTVGPEVRTEGVAWGLSDLADAVRGALQQPGTP